MAERVVLTVGSVLRGDDAAGPYLALLLEKAGVRDWTVIDGGQTPEDELGAIRRRQPDVVVVVDAADMGLPAGAVRRLRREDVRADYLLTTHALPLSILIGELEQMADDVVFIGIQPASTTFFDPLTPSVRNAVERLCGMFERNEGFDRIPWVGEADG